MRFLNGEETTAEIVKLAKSSKKVRMAVAFWGNGATKGLNLGRSGYTVNVDCNLKSGGTNPHEIENLQTNGVVVQQRDTLHGKVYLFDKEVIVGSSNASANGLALQGNEISGWHEANMITDDRSIHDAAEKWITNLNARYHRR
jgi:phosphatidylserine/phosphatidylglycerophosphate/cardiolipin synthase-like enzyme